MNSSTRNDPTCLRAILFLILAACVFGAFRAWRKLLIARRWPVTTGTVIDSSISSTRMSRGGISFQPQIVYDYQVEGHTFRNTQFNLDTGRSQYPGQHHRVSRTVERYPAGHIVSVYYNPENPQESVLELGMTEHVFLTILAVVFLALLIVLPNLI